MLELVENGVIVHGQTSHPLSRNPVSSWNALRLAIEEASQNNHLQNNPTPHIVTINGNITAPTSTVGRVIQVSGGREVILRSGSGGRFSLIQDNEGQRHFQVEGVHTKFTIENVILTRSASLIQDEQGTLRPVENIPLGGGVTIGSASNFIIGNGAVINRCRAESGGAVATIGTGVFRMEEGAVIGDVTNEINGNSAELGGGVFLGSGGFLYMEGGHISNNRASSNVGGGVTLSTNSQFIMNDGTISRNRTGRLGGAGVTLAGNSNSTFTMTGGLIGGFTPEEGNQSFTGAGGVAVQATTTFIMEGGIIANNRASGTNGGGIVVSGGEFRLRGPGTKIFMDNEANENGGGIFWGGGLIRTAENTGEVIIANNVAGANGGGIYMGASTDNLTITKEWDIRENWAKAGGGISIARAGNLVIDKGIIERNTAEIDGGGDRKSVV
jgi:hypothetical protein